MNCYNLTTKIVIYAVMNSITYPSLVKIVIYAALK